jgi:ribulose 1,5-bisphosphate synthetase/thiazole synthase
MAPFLTNDNREPGENRHNEAGEATVIDGMETTAQLSHSSNGVDYGVDTEFLIVGAGPAGAALACFLASHGMCLD